MWDYPTLFIPTKNVGWFYLKVSNQLNCSIKEKPEFLNGNVSFILRTGAFTWIVYHLPLYHLPHQICHICPHLFVTFAPTKEHFCMQINPRKLGELFSKNHPFCEVRLP